MPRPFVIEPPLGERDHYDPGDELDFGLILFGHAIDYLPHFVITLRELGPSGIGSGRGKATLERVATTDGEVLYTEGATAIAKPTGVLTGMELVRRVSTSVPQPGDASPTDITLHFLTPVRLQDQGELLSQALFPVVIRALLRRASSVSYFHHGIKLDVDFRGIAAEAGKIRLTDSHIRWYDWRRYSSRQRTKIAMGGFIGWAAYQGDMVPFLPLLEVGRWLHLGKNVTFGLGQYSWEVNTGKTA